MIDTLIIDYCFFAMPYYDDDSFRLRALRYVYATLLPYGVLRACCYAPMPPWRRYHADIGADTVLFDSGALRLIDIITADVTRDACYSAS